MSNLKQLCQGKWKSLLPMFGVNAEVLTGKHQACPLCPGSGGRDRFRFDDREGNGTYFCSQCGAGDGIEFLKKLKGWEFKQAAEELEKVVGKAERGPAPVKRDSFQVRNWMQEIWLSGKEIERFNPAGIYLANRAIAPSVYPSTLRYVEKCYYEKGVYLPAMVAIFQATDGIAGQLHRTFITRDGRKADVETVRKTMPLPFPEGGAVRLGGGGSVLGIAEGIESALAAGMSTDFPVWAALNKVNLMKFEPPAETEELYIFSDNDGNFAGQAHAYGLAQKLKHRNPDISVTVCIPAREDTDWNDELIARQTVVA